MGKKYTYLLLLFVFGLFFSQSSYGQMLANNDQGSVTYSNTVQIAIQNVLGNDTLNGIPVTLSDVTFSQISSTTHVTLQPNGSVVVNAGAPTGYYEIFYDVCQIGNPGNCDYAFAYVTVNPVPIVANSDAVTISTGLVVPQIILENVLSNDTLGGIPISISDAYIQQISSTASTYFSIDYSTANVLVISNPPPGIYTLEYYYCINSCTNAFATITVVNSLLTTINSTYQDFNGDGITNVGDVVNYTYSITNIGNTAVSNISITSSEVNINGGPPIPLLNPSANNNTTYTGVHVITQEDINNGSVVVGVQTNGTLSGNPISVTTTDTQSLNIANGVQLNAFIDYNGNGTQENGEPNFLYGSFQYQLNDNGTVHNIISSNGIHYLYETNPTNSYDFGFTINPAYTSQYSVAPASYANVTVANGSGIVTYNFAVTQIPYSDLGINVYGWIPPRPGFDYENYVTYFNYGNQTIASGTVTFTKGSNVSILSVSPSGSTPTAGGFTYNFTNLLPGESRTFAVMMQVPTIPTVNLGDLVTNTASISIPSNDINVNNNSSSLTQTIVGSYDPNDKAESHGPQIQHSTFSTNDYLTYTIRFENTGTAEAINIRVNDVLDADLDETTVRMVTASHPYVLDRVGSNLTWRFDGVNLEPSIPGNSVIGHGYIVFQVKPKPGYIIGDVIPNTANIYFDFNPAIVTNTWTTEFVLQLSNPDFTAMDFEYYPNPVKNSLTLSSETIINNIEIYSVLGQKVKSFKVDGIQTEINLSELNQGLYFIKVTSAGQEKTVKIIKE
ncbi:T9SS type A sorting domain-containing protein [Flavobacterium sp. IMCC34852]|uniref:T9SS type A sorting domain-containing protein n=1 Tax=Flavobacterium rivulicola TaxID=2732161 RepID=A0A7Y3VXM9_9FLAO|nr:T9SS type A sorting domain-containing protein [Flavobacterium sp. IMCC34852]NNT70804.1 T9SS type A sorting domain-containing protein [Flavobacterium sp. IMCC34852]